MERISQGRRREPEETVKLVIAGGRRREETWLSWSLADWQRVGMTLPIGLFSIFRFD